MTKQNLPMAPQMILRRNQLNELKLSKTSSRQQQKTKHVKIKTKQRVETSFETIRNQIISAQREKMPKCENKQKQEINYFMRWSLKFPTNSRRMKQTWKKLQNDKFSFKMQTRKKLKRAGMFEIK